MPAISENIDGYGCFRLNVLWKERICTLSLPVGTLLVMYFSLACDSELADL